MSEKREHRENTQPENIKSNIGKFAIGASAGLFGGGVGGLAVYELITDVFHQTVNALPVIGGPALGIGILYGIRSIRRNN